MAKDKMTYKKPMGTGATRLKFDNNPSIAPTPEAGPSAPAMDKGMWSKNALGSMVDPTAEYAAKSKKQYFQSGTTDHIMPNTLWPTDKY